MSHVKQISMFSPYILLFIKVFVKKKTKKKKKSLNHVFTILKTKVYGTTEFMSCPLCPHLTCLPLEFPKTNFICLLPIT